MPSWYGQGKVYLYHFVCAHSKYITLFRNTSLFMFVEMNTETIRMCMKVGGRDPWGTVWGSLNEFNTAPVSLLYLHNRY
jgi:hypothetical protein